MTDRPRPVTPYAPFEEPARSLTPANGMPAVTPPPPSTRPSEFTSAVRDELARIEQSIVENVKRTLHALGTAVLAKQDSIRTEIGARLDAQARELRTLRDAVARDGGTILPPPPEGL